MTRETVTIYVPDGYASSTEFLKDCGFEPSHTTATMASAEPVAWQYRYKLEQGYWSGWVVISEDSYNHLSTDKYTTSEIELRTLYASPPPPADTVREALERLEADARSPQQLYDRSGASFTSPGGTEYEFTSAHLDKCNELADSVAAIIAALSSTAPIEAGWRDALLSIVQRANESGTGEMGLIDTIHDICRIANAQLSRKERGAP